MDVYVIPPKSPHHLVAPIPVPIMTSPSVNIALMRVKRPRRPSFVPPTVDDNDDGSIPAKSASAMLPPDEPKPKEAPTAAAVKGSTCPPTLISHSFPKATNLA